VVVCASGCAGQSVGVEDEDPTAAPAVLLAASSTTSCSTDSGGSGASVDLDHDGPAMGVGLLSASDSTVSTGAAGDTPRSRAVIAAVAAATAGPTPRSCMATAASTPRSCTAADAGKNVAGTATPGSLGAVLRAALRMGGATPTAIAAPGVQAPPVLPAAAATAAATAAAAAAATAASTTPVTASAGGGVNVLVAASGPVARAPPPAPIRAVELGPDGRVVYPQIPPSPCPPSGARRSAKSTPRTASDAVARAREPVGSAGALGCIVVGGWVVGGASRWGVGGWVGRCRCHWVDGWSRAGGGGAGSGGVDGCPVTTAHVLLCCRSRACAGAGQGRMCPPRRPCDAAGLHLLLACCPHPLPLPAFLRGRCHCHKRRRGALAALSHTGAAGAPRGPIRRRLGTRVLAHRRGAARVGHGCARAVAFYAPQRAASTAAHTPTRPACEAGREQVSPPPSLPRPPRFRDFRPFIRACITRARPPPTPPSSCSRRLQCRVLPLPCAGSAAVPWTAPFSCRPSSYA
jgi:hypothetical protein